MDESWLTTAGIALAKPFMIVVVGLIASILHALKD